jgi:alpha-tubulin suppressor-like RCC1 family protein
MKSLSDIPQFSYAQILLLALLLTTRPAGAANTVYAWGGGTIVNPSDFNQAGQSIIPANLTNAILVAGGWRHSLALKADGTLQGWGDDLSAQTDFPPGSKYVAIACGRNHSLALQSNGIVLATGDDTYGQIDVPSSLSNAVAVACGWYHSLVLKSDGTVQSWGTSTNPADFGSNDNYGQSSVPPGLNNVVAIAGGGWHSVALKADGTVSCWGRNDSGESTIPSGLSNVVAIAATTDDSVALEANGKIVVWGDNTYGQASVPPNLTNGIATIAAGGWHCLALKTNGIVVSWGASVGSYPAVDYGQTNVPVGLTNVIRIAGGLVNSLVLKGGGPPPIKAFFTSQRFTTNGFLATLPTSVGRTYRLEYQNALTNQNWTALPLQFGSGGSQPFVDPTPSSSQRFYRISRW